MRQQQQDELYQQDHDVRGARDVPIGEREDGDRTGANPRFREEREDDEDL